MSAETHREGATIEHRPDVAPTGIAGLDRILRGGVPAGRPTLLRGAAGTGKTVIALTFLCHGIAAGEPGVLVTFDESPEALLAHAEGFGFPARRHVAEGRLRILDMRPDRNEVQVGETIELTVILARIAHALEGLAATRLVIDAIDGIEATFASYPSLRSELARVFDWIRERRVTCLITTGERGEFSTRYGLEDYVADCVIALRQEVTNRVMTRVLRVVKRRGGAHETNEYPFLLDAGGLFLVPVTGAELTAKVSDRRLSTGIPGLDAMLGGDGPYRGSTVLLSGQAGTGKTSLACSLVRAACEAGLAVLYISFEESIDELTRNQRVLGLDLARYRRDGHEAAGPEDHQDDHRDDHPKDGLVLRPVRAVELGLEEHLMRVMRLIGEYRPDLVVLDPISSLAGRGHDPAAKETLLRLLHLLKAEGVTLIATELLSDDGGGVSHLDVSSMIDVWIRLRRHENDGEINRLITVVKARGLPISNQVKEFRISGAGLAIEEPYLGTGGIAYGTARLARAAEDEAELEQLDQELERARHARDQLTEVTAAAARLARIEEEAKGAELDRRIAQIEQRLAQIARARAAVSRGRE
ncbi:ATPase domain-containing protein [Thiococcus pfennigii]|uniref:ATPase domain-containing protein n=1 Tax=Thiococcus pfennigii TaxID=1057 RepID=UPI0019088502|nr:ATPase domain-containing protein [Thiococcus pfennigii]MBK1700408.1 circadian clock protein KaiC [Thiococcus pfennigii]MBK1731625.1 circadian clock protein KaiC [Thiococcus pfennigii]